MWTGGGGGWKARWPEIRATIWARDWCLKRDGALRLGVARNSGKSASEPNRIAGHLVGVRRVGELVGVGQTPTADVRNLVGRNKLDDDNDRTAPHLVTGPRFPGVVRTHGSRRLSFTYDLSSGSCETRGTMIFDARDPGCSSSRGYSGKARCSR